MDMSAAVGSPPRPTVAHLDLIRSVLGSDHATAELLGVSRSQLTRWRRGQTPEPLNADGLAALALLVEMLCGWLEAEVVAEWLHGANAHLDGRTPAFMLRQHRLADVIGALEAEKRGVFA
jgi:DNA-binding transcriptional regulator YdaS (Cro superfamily)